MCHHVQHVRTVYGSVHGMMSVDDVDLCRWRRMLCGVVVARMIMFSFGEKATTRPHTQTLPVKTKLACTQNTVCCNATPLSFSSFSSLTPFCYPGKTFKARMLHNNLQMAGKALIQIVPSLVLLLSHKERRPLIAWPFSDLENFSFDQRLFHIKVSLANCSRESRVIVVLFQKRTKFAQLWLGALWRSLSICLLVTMRLVNGFNLISDQP